MAVSEWLHFLFVCYANAERSPTAEAVCRRVTAENSLDIEASSAGISCGAHRPVTRKMAGLADKIFVMEPDMVREMAEGYGQNPAKIVCLDIPDIYERDEPRLVAMLEQKLYEYLMHEGLL
jgi:predicted protein tyrosine phosphatase